MEGPSGGEADALLERDQASTKRIPGCSGSSAAPCSGPRFPPV